jgi:hypothetical protein
MPKHSYCLECGRYLHGRDPRDDEPSLWFERFHFCGRQCARVFEKKRREEEMSDPNRERK